MEALKLVPYIFLTLAIAGIIAGAGILTTGQMGEAVSQKCWNSSYTYSTTLFKCTNNTANMSTTGFESRNLSDAYYGVLKSQEGMGDVAEQFPTIGIIAVMVVIISLIAGVFVYMNYFR